VLTYIFRPPEQSFPPFFDGALIARLAAEFVIPLTENTARAELMFKLAEAEFRAARLTDSQQDTPLAVQDFALIGARG
jgi:methylglyoxal synthase